MPRRSHRLRWDVTLAVWLSATSLVCGDDLLLISGPTMGTTYSVKIAQPPADLTSADLQREVESYLSEFDRHVSTYRPDSDLSRFNAARRTDWFEVDRETALVVQQALQAAAQSDGAFDPTVGPLVRLWGFDRRQGRTELPSANEVAAARALVDHRRVQVRRDPPALRKEVPALELDVNGIAPGYAVDRLVERLAARGLAQVMVDVGGEIRATGRKADGSSWRVGIERPAAGLGTGEARRLQAAVPLDDLAVATSGDYRNAYLLAGRRYSHTIDPRTGHPVRHDLASVTIFAADAATADGMATAVMVLGPEEGLSLADRLGLQAWLLVRDASGGVTPRVSTAFTRGVGRQLEDLIPADANRGARSQTPPAASTRPSANISLPRAVPERASTSGPDPWTILPLALAIAAATFAGFGILQRGKSQPEHCGGAGIDAKAR